MIKHLMTASLVASALIAGTNVYAANDSSLTKAHWLASDVYGAAVYDPNQNKIGKIDDLVISKDGTVSKAVVGVGGFLGVGEKDVAIPFNELKVASDNSSSWLVLNESKDQLKAAPSFDKNNDQ
jgi:sporulation protein YlmC with PRC-barrel domain